MVANCYWLLIPLCVTCHVFSPGNKSQAIKLQKEFGKASLTSCRRQPRYSSRLNRFLGLMPYPCPCHILPIWHPLSCSKKEGGRGLSAALSSLLSCYICSLLPAPTDWAWGCFLFWSVCSFPGPSQEQKHRFSTCGSSDLKRAKGERRCFKR